MPQLEDYQLRFVSAVEKVIAANWLQKRPNIQLLDMGCDCTGRQLAEISRLIRGEAVGINLPSDFPFTFGNESGRGAGKANPYGRNESDFSRCEL